MSIDKPIILLGMMASGKSTLASLLAEKLNLKFISIDEHIAEEAQKSIPEIFAQNGESVFRKFESRNLAKVLKQLQENHLAVVDTGGGIAQNSNNQKLLTKFDAYKIYLAASPEILSSRINDISTRPMLQTGSILEQIKDIMTDRDANYKNVSSHIIDISAADTIEDTLNKIIEIVTP